MSTLLNPYLQFDGNAREAMEFYQGALGGDLEVSTFGDMGGPADAPGADKVMHAQLTTPDGFTLMASDTPPGMEFQPGSNFAVSLSGDEAEKMRGWWQRLSAEGTVSVPLEKQMWGDEFGQCTDRFGVAWMVNIAGSQA
ncbi:VOC family protein [Desertihabitans aurantiacus]|uniref:VOC family protein n=1 Tax=Desertihabitans aurantiacus TaxID=2282477 RepID=UPI000DF7FA78|nr:VOC family protein [Desertihabitans aurantiacus]